MLKRLPKMPGLWLMLGPAFVWAAIAQGSGELIWWPYFSAKYGLAFVGLLLPASLIQFFVNREVSRYTAITGKGIWSGFLSLGKYFTYPLFLLCFVNFLWLGGYASAGGTALFELTSFPVGFTDRGGTLFWSYVLIISFSGIFLFSKIIYKSLESFMKIVSAVTVFGLIFSSLQPQVRMAAGEFFKSFFNPTSIRWPSAWESSDSSHLVTAIAFAGMGGFLNLLYSYWMKDKGVGMAKYSTKIKGLLVKEEEIIEDSSDLIFEDTEENKIKWAGWLRFLNFDSLLAVTINAVTAGLTTLLAYAILFPQGIFPTGWKITVVQAQFFESSLGYWGRILFLLVASAFMIDTWVGLVDGVARQFADFVVKVKSFGKSFRFWYYLWLLFLILTSLVTITFAQPGVLITIVGVISIFAFVFYIPALWYLNYVKLPKIYPKFIKPKKWESVTLWGTWLFYTVVAVGYLIVIF
jgi:hypothetical protein